jgi:hypothetical protein
LNWLQEVLLTQTKEDDQSIGRQLTLINLHTYTLTLRYHRSKAVKVLERVGLFILAEQFELYGKEVRTSRSMRLHSQQAVCIMKALCIK